jgi:hypothetical protein
MLLQNRNALGHAFTKDIAGNAGDKPLQPTFPDKGGRLRSLLFHAAIATDPVRTVELFGEHVLVCVRD